jgi:hypothetical protein
VCRLRMLPPPSSQHPGLLGCGKKKTQTVEKRVRTVWLKNLNFLLHLCWSYISVSVFWSRALLYGISFVWNVFLMGFFCSLYARKFSDPLHWLQGEDDSMWEKKLAPNCYITTREDFSSIHTARLLNSHVLSEIKLMFFFSRSWALK